MLAVVDFLSQLAIVAPRLLARPQPGHPARQPLVLRRGADADGVPARDPDRHRRLHRHRDDLEHGRRGARPRDDDPRRDQARDDRRLRDLLHAAARRAVGAAGRVRRRRVPRRSSASARGRRLRRTTRSSASSRAWTSARCRASPRSTSAVLAVTILIAATNAGVLGVSRLTYSMGMYRQLPDTMRRLHRRYRTPYVGILVFSGVACLALLPGQADFLGKIYAFGAMLSFSMAHLSLIRLRVIGARRSAARIAARAACAGAATSCRCWRSSASPGTALSFVVVSVLDLTVGVAGVTWMALGMGGYVALPPPPGPRPRHDAPGRRAAAGDRHRGRVRVGARGARRAPLLAADDRDRDEARVGASGAGSTCSCSSRSRRPTRSRRRCPRTRSRRALSIIEQAKQQGGRRVTGHVEKVRPGGRRAADRRRGARDARARDRHAAAAAHRHDAVRQDRRDRARRAPVPRHHRVRADADA